MKPPICRCCHNKPEAGSECPECHAQGPKEEGSVWLEYEPSTIPETVIKGFEAEENECVATLLQGIPTEGGSASKEIFERLVRMSFQGGLAAAIGKRC